MSGIKIVQPTCNDLTVKDGRGGIFTYLLADPVVEANLVLLKAGKWRGAHFHKEFVEYFLVVSGRGLYQSVDENGKRFQAYVTGGEMLRLPVGVPHIIYAIEDMQCVAMLSKRWDDCEEPITAVQQDDLSHEL